MTNTPHTAEALEREHLVATLQLLIAESDRLADSIDTSVRTIQERKEYLWENRRDMDFAEKADFRSSVDVSIALGERAAMTRARISRLLETPYFGRVDFRRREETDTSAYYIGVHNFIDRKSQEIVIHDWRAPVSSLYYDFESGQAHFETPEEIARGEITSKRQYKIRGGHLEYMLESSLNIGDDVLQRELSQSADEKMKNIVATIQREQNAVIRNEAAQVLILQGVAGSGKTSIALHRIAFLLYRYKDSLSSDNVMILSPNKVFGDYISNVLPELGEEKVAEIDFDAIAARFLVKVTNYETFNEQVAKLLDSVDESAVERMRYKATTDFVRHLDAWIASQTQQFMPSEITQKYRHLSPEWVARIFDQLGNLPIFTRLARVADIAVHQLKQDVLDAGGKWSTTDTNSVRRQVRSMFPHKDPFAMYKAYKDPHPQGMFKSLGRKKIEYADVFPLIYTMISTERQENFGHIRHLLIDEMQDYTPVQYAVLRKLFSCKMTILGDSNQSVNPFSSSSLPTIRSIFPDADCLELCKSYRSTTEITAFTQNISQNSKLVPISRHGLPPQIIAAPDRAGEQSHIAAILERHGHSDHRSLGIVCKTDAQARDLYSALSTAGAELALLDHDSTAFVGGIVITSAHIAKGLEFDVVVVPHADTANYASDMDRCMLYIACTRAMHELYLTYGGALSRFLDFASDPEESAFAHAR